MDGGVQAYIGLGANVGPARRSLELAVAALATLPGAAVTGVSRLYRTRPVGPPDQPDFLNAAVSLRWAAESGPGAAALGLLGELKRIERELGRRERERWGPREVDLDLLTFGDERIRTERPAALRSDDPGRAGRQWLEVPHPAAAERLFVLAPLAELAPDLRPPGWRHTIAEARDRRRAIEGANAAEVVADWDPATGTWTEPG